MRCSSGVTGALATDRTRTFGRAALIGLATTVLVVFLVLPLGLIFLRALERGLAPLFDALSQPDAASAIRLTFTVALIAVPLNTLFGLAASWAITKFEFSGKSILVTLID